MFNIIMSSFLIFFLSSLSCAEDFPSKPIHIVVYTAPGGLIDVTARKIANIIQRDLVDVPVVVENKKGAGGIVALNYVNNKIADGHTILGLTSSVISKAVSAKQDKLLDDLHYLALVAEDYEAIITSKKSGVLTLDEIKNKATGLKRPQVWVGPASGGTDHIFALKVWDAIDLKANWIPYRSGGEAIAALMGGHGAVYVGNPSDTHGRPDLHLTAVAAPERLSNFPDVPTFKELGYTSLTGESLWRGFAIRKDVPKKVKIKLENLLQKATSSAEWKAFVKQGGVIERFKTGEEFKQLVTAQLKSDKQFLKRQ